MKKLPSPFFAFSLLFIFLYFFLPSGDTDLGWHLRYGQYFIETGKFLHENILTYYLPGYVWNNTYSLYQIFIYLVNKTFGFLGLSIANSLLFITSFIFFNKINPKCLKINFILFFIVILFGRNVFGLGIRDQEFSFLFLIIEFFILKKSEEKNKFLFYLIPLFTLWVNIHGAFILGLILLLAYAINQAFNKNFKKMYTILKFLVFSLFATLINPWGIGVYAEIIKVISTPLKLLIVEWVGPSLIVKLLILGLFILSSYFSIRSNNKNKFFWIILLTIFLYLSFTAKRNIILFALVTALALIDLKKDLTIKLEKSKIAGKFNIMLLILASLYLLSFRIPKTLDINLNWQSYCTKGYLKYPCKAVDFIRMNNLSGENVFSYYEWGGFLEWQLPKYKFFVDGRVPTWETPEGQSPNTIYLEIIMAEPEYQKKLERYQTDWLLLPVNSYLDYELRQKSNIYWEEIYRDNISVIYIPKRIF